MSNSNKTTLLIPAQESQSATDRVYEVPQIDSATLIQKAPFALTIEDKRALLESLQDYKPHTWDEVKEIVGTSPSYYHHIQKAKSTPSALGLCKLSHVCRC